MLFWWLLKVRHVTVPCSSKRHGLNSSYAIFQDATGRAFERVVAFGYRRRFAIFETTFFTRSVPDLTGERGTFDGCYSGNLVGSVRNFA